MKLYGDSLLYYTKFIKYFDDTNEFFRFFQHGFGGCPGLIDRTNIFNIHSNIKIETNHGININLLYHDLSLLIDYRANDIIKRNKRTLILWSGGIDSTAALISLLKNAPKNWIKRNLFLVFNDITLKENLKLYNKIKNYINLLFIDKHFILDELNKKFNKNDDIIVTGEMGDQIMGNHFSMKNPELSLLPLTPVILEEYKSLNNNFYWCQSQNFDVDFIFSMIGLIKNNNYFSIKTLNDLLTYMNLFFTWDFNCNRYIHKNILFDNIFNFFDTDYFFTWGVYNHEIKTNRLYENKYKIEYLDYIFDFIKDDYVYGMKKRTSPSTSSSILNSKDKNIIIAIDNKYNIYYNTTIDRLKLMRFYNDKIS